MNQYSIQKSQILKLIDPYEQNFLAVDKINRSEIKTALENLNIFENSQGSIRENLIRKIAFLTLNQEYQNIGFKFHESKLVCTDIPSLMAALYNENGNMVITINSVEVLNELNVNFESTDIISKDYKEDSFSWNKIENLSETTWNNKEFVLNQIKRQNSDDWKEVFEFSNPLLWEDIEFLEKVAIYKIKCLEGLPSELFFTETMFELAKTNDTILKKITTNYFSGLLKTGEYSNEYDTFKPAIKLKKLEKIESPSESQLQEIIKYKKLEELAHKLLVRYKNEILTDKTYVLKLLSIPDNMSIYRALPINLKKDHDIIKQIFALVAGKTYYSYFNSIETILDKEMFKEPYILEKYMKEVLIKTNDLNKYPWVYEYWIKDKEKIKEYSQYTSNTLKLNDYSKKYELVEPNDPFLKFFDLLPKEMRKDEDVMAIFIEKNPRIYTRLGQEVRKSKKTVIPYITKMPGLAIEYKEDKISDEVLMSLTKEELKLALRLMPKLVLRNELTQKWLTDPELVSCLGKAIAEIKVSKKVWEETCSNEQYCFRLLEENKNNYKMLTSSAKMNINVATKYAEEEYIQILEKEIPKQIWGSINFCLSLIKRNKAISTLMPEQLWNNRFFISEVAKMVDDGQLKIDFFNKGPTKINELINTYQLGSSENKGTCQKFFDNYMSQVVLKEELSVSTVVKKRVKI